jgi:DNA-binding response OmpR family regulator
MGLFLTLFGHEVRMEFSAASALVRAAEFMPMVIILDISMPGMDGCEVAVKLREMFQDQVLLVAVTGRDSPRDRERCMQAGFDHFLVKPADPFEVENLIECFVRSAQESESSDCFAPSPEKSRWTYPWSVIDQGACDRERKEH